MMRLLLLSTLFAPLVLTTPAVSADENEALITHRQGIYKIVSGHTNAIKSILFQNHPATDELEYHSQGILNAFSKLGQDYAPGSEEGKTRASSKIWEDMDGFRDAGKSAYEAAKALDDKVKFGDREGQIQAFKDLGASCKGCHKEYRKEK
ncbi:MAG: cytochrome c [Gammaproteobacteria bacterium]|nr:cytochrome c [Gammaproteobacteria bacterium]